MTPIIKNPNVRRRLITRGTLPAELLPPPSAVFGGEQAQAQLEEALEAGNAEEYDDTPIEEVAKLEEPTTRRIPHNTVRFSKPSKVKVISSEEEPSEEESFTETEPVKVEKKFKGKKTGTNPVEDIMKAMRSGEAIMIKCDGLNSYQVSIIPNDIIVSKTGFRYLKKGITGKQYWIEVLNPEFTEWVEKWGKMTYTEKKAYADKLGVVWRRSETNERLDVMNMAEAVRKAENIEKYKPEYMKRTARAKIRG
jgi:hypothetical protein